MRPIGRPALAVAIGAGAVFAAGLLTLASGVPTLISPLGFPVALFALLSTDWVSLHITTDAFWHAVIVYSVAALPLAVCFTVWSWTAIARHERVPLRSAILFGVASALCAWFFVVAWSYGLRYQGFRYTAELLGINITVFGALASVLVANWRTPKSWSNILFHIGVFCWLAWCAFPWLGELI